MGLSCRSQKPSKVSSRDGRSPDAVLLRRTKADLTVHIGGKPSATQRALIDRAAMLTLHLARMDQKAMETGEFSDHASRHYLAWSNSLRLNMVALGLQPAKAARPSLRDYLDGRTDAAA